MENDLEGDGHDYDEVASDDGILEVTKNEIYHPHLPLVLNYFDEQNLVPILKANERR